MPHPRPGPCHATRVYTLIAGSTLTVTHCQCLPDLWSNAALPPSNSLLPHRNPPSRPTNPHYTTPTPSFPILGDFPDFPPKFERDSCIETPIFRWTPLPEAIPSRRNDPDFCPRSSNFRPTTVTPQSSHQLYQVPPPRINSPYRRQLTTHPVPTAVYQNNPNMSNPRYSDEHIAT